MRRLLLAALLLLPLNLLAAETVEVTADGARIRSEPSTSAAVVATVKSGTILTVLETRGDWHRIEAPGGAKGWINRTLVRARGGRPTAAPSPTPAAQSGSWKATGQTIRRGFIAERTDEVTASAGARGLDESGGTGGRSDMNAVRRMDTWVPGREEIRAFIREGGLSPEHLP